MNKTRFELNLPEHLKASASQLAEAQSLSLSALMRLALHQYLDRNQKGTA